MIERVEEINGIIWALKEYPVVAIVGARQVGKTTLAREIARRHGKSAVFFDLENPSDLARLRDPMLVLQEIRGLVVLDEIQTTPEIFRVLRVLADRPGTPARFLVLGSASPDLLRQSSETLAGRVHYHHLQGFALPEVGTDKWEQLWLRGGFPKSFLAKNMNTSAEWRRDFILTFLQRDLPQFGIQIPAATMHRFWSMLAHFHGQVWNASEFGRSFGVADTTVRRYLDILAGTWVVRLLLPWLENLKKRQVQSPKVYFPDTGLLHSLLGLKTSEELHRHPRLGASWEGFAMEQVIRRLGARPEECFFWATHAGAELDLLVVRGTEKLGFEFKYSSAPELTRSMRIALEDLRLSSLDVVYPGSETYPLLKNARAVPLTGVWKNIKPL